MMALAVLTLGAATVISTQKATLIANTNARNLAAATQIAQGWIERIRVDALAWNYPAGSATTPDIGDTKWLSSLSTTWSAPIVSATLYPTGAPTADIMSADILGSDTSTPAFCTQARVTQYGSNASLWALSRLARVEVRVFWDKRGAAIDCTSQTSATLPNNFGAVYLVSGALANNAPF